MKKILLSLLIGLLATTAQAGLLLEPHLGYDNTRVVKNATATPAIDSGFATAAPSFGLRLGYKVSMLWLAADVDYATGKNAYNSTSANPTNFSFSRTDGYALIGLDFPMFIRGWVGYGFSSKMTLQTTGGDTVDSGTSVKGGIGLKLIPKVSLNVEYVVRSMTDEKIGTAASSKITSTYSTYKDVGAVFSISVPFNF